MKLRILLASVIASLGVTLGSSATTPASAADGSDYIATCLQSARSVSALFMFDKSGSLSGTDGEGIRYDGLKLAIESLSGVQRADGQPIAIEAAISSFDDRYHSARDVVDWTRLNSGGDSDVSKTIDRMISDAQKSTGPGGGTNFHDALAGADQDLEDRGSQGSCRILFWFTDGQDGSGTLQSSACAASPNGLVDQMREQGIVIVGLQLGPDTGDLQAIATGTAPGAQCGVYPVPSDSAQGIYIRANDSAALRALFGRLGNIVRGCTPQGNRGANIDPGVRAMSVTLSTSQQVKLVRLDSPDGTVIAAPAHGSTSVAGYTTTTQSDDTYATVTVDFPADKGAGSWSVTSDPPVAPNAMTFCVFSGLHLVRVHPKMAPKAGGKQSIEYEAVDATGTEADLSDYKDVALGASVVASNGDLRKAVAKRVGNHVVVTFDSQPTDARLQMKLTATPTTVSGLTLAPLAVDEGFGLQLSKAFPTISPIDQLNLGTAEKDAEAQAKLTLVGSPLGPTQVCFAKPTGIVVPHEDKGQTVRVPSGCVLLATGESKTVTISVKPLKPTVGDGEATLPVTLVPATGSQMAGQRALVNLPVLWRYENPRDAVVLLAVLVIASLLSVALPLIALGLANLLTARFQVSGLRGEVIPVVIGEDGPRRIEPLEGNPTAVIESYKTSVVPTTGRRKFRYGPVELVSKAYLSPLKAPTFVVSPIAAGYRVLSSVPPPTADGTVANASPGLGFLAVAVISEADLKNPSIGEVPAQLVVLVRDTSVASANLDPIMNSTIDWRVVTERWREGVDVRPGSTGGDDSTSGTTSFSHLDGGSNASTLDLGSMGHLDLGDD